MKLTITMTFDGTEAQCTKIAKAVQSSIVPNETPNEGKKPRTPKASSSKKKNTAKKGKSSSKKKTFEQKMADWGKKADAFVPNAKQIAWLKANPLCTREQAKAKGFVCTKDGLKALKAKYVK